MRSPHYTCSDCGELVDEITAIDSWCGQCDQPVCADCIDKHKHDVRAGDDVPRAMDCARYHADK